MKDAVRQFFIIISGLFNPFFGNTFIGAVC